MKRFSRRARSGQGIWEGGQHRIGVTVREPAPFQPDALMWVDPSCGVLAVQIVNPTAPDITLGDLLRQAMRRPLVGPPRRPGAVRVGSEAMAAALRHEVPEIPVQVGPTPDLDHAMLSLQQHMAGGGRDAQGRPDGALCDQGIAAAVARKLFDAAKLLFEMAPWKKLSERDLVRVDAPSLDLEGGCLCVIGGAGEQFGLLLFPSDAGYEAFLRAASRKRPVPGEDLDLGPGFLALSFEPLAQQSKARQQEVKRHGWPVAKLGYPVLERRDGRGVPVPIREADATLVTEIALAFTTFVLRWGDRIASGEPTSVTIETEDVAVRLTAPYEAYEDFERAPAPARRAAKVGSNDPDFERAAAPARRAAKVGRNDPCPCGSGKKLKACHGSWNEGAPAAVDRRAHRAHEIDARIVKVVGDWAEKHHPDDLDLALESLGGTQAGSLLSLVWAVYGHRSREGSLAERYLAQHRARLAPADRSWIEAQGRSFIGIWEVVGLPGGGKIEMEDLLSGEKRLVHDESAAESIDLRHALLGRVVDYEDVSLLCGAHDQALPPQGAARVVDRVRSHLRSKALAAPARLRSTAFAKRAVKWWSDVAADLEAAAKRPPALHNTDGDPLLITIDRFEIDPGCRPAVEAGLRDLPGLQVTDPRPGELSVVRPGRAAHGGMEDPVIGTIHFEGSRRLRVETNSVARADRLRDLVEAAAGGSIRHRSREHVDPTSVAHRSPGPIPDPEDMPAEVLAAVRAHKQAHYARWVDDRLPALDGKTPREAVRTRAGRAKVDQMLKEIEYAESRMQAGTAVDVSVIRRDLGL